jgi:itaconyl-CoA hydratase
MSGQTNVQTIPEQSMAQGGKRRIPTRMGRYLEDFEVGDVYVHRPGRTITESDNINFSLMTMNQHPMHCDAAYAAKSEFGRPLVNSTLTLAIAAGMSVNDVSGKAIANLGWKHINLTAPVFPGDTLYAESEVLEKRISKSRPTQGVVTVATRAFNQNGKPVIDFVRSALIPKRGHGVGES